MAIGYHREVSIKFDIRSVGIFDVVSARLGDGEVFDSAKLKNTVRFLIENDMRNVVIDLGNLEYLYSDTINAFIASNRHMLEVSDRIAILTEHPKVQDILKRAGLDNIMRIYRSEAEMIADSKEILRQTSSYRIEELQKISTQPPPQEAPPSVRTEFDDFKMEMGQRLGSKLDNNEVPQYQLGVSQNTAPAPAGFGTTPPTRETASPYPSFNQPGFTVPPAPESVPTQGQPGYVPAQPAPAFGSFNNAPAYGMNNNGAPAYGGQQAGGFGQSPSNFDFPTVQLPVGSFGGTTQPISAPSGPSAPTAPPGQGFPPQDPNDQDPRSRKSSQERMRSPNARRQQSRRVGGREFPGGMEDSQEMPAYVEERAPEVKAPSEQFGSYNIPPSTPNTLVEESRSPFKLIAFLFVLAAIGAGLYFFMNKSPSETKDVIGQGVPSAVPEPSEVLTPPMAEATPPAVDPGAAVVPTPPTVPPTSSTPAPAVKPPVTAPPVAETPKVEPPAPVAPKPAPEKVASRTPPASAKKPKPAPVEKAAPRAPAPDPEDEPSQPSVGAGKLRITSVPSNAEVLVNFSKKGNTPVEISLLNNSNKIIVRLPGYKRFEITLPKNHPDRNLDVSLDREEGAAEARPEPEAAPAPKPKPPEKPAPRIVDEPEDDPEDLPMSKPERKPEPIARQEPPKPKFEAAPAPGDGPIGVIFLSSSPARADIIIDGKNTGKKTPAKVELPSGNHRIEMVRSGQRSVVDQNVNEGKNKALHLTLQ